MEDRVKFHGRRTLAAMSAITEALPYHLADPTHAQWVRCPDSTLRALLVEYLGVNPSDNRRPAQWGQTKDTSA